MNRYVKCLTLLSAMTPLAAWASCDAVKDAIDAKLKAKNIPSYTLDIRDAGDPGDGKVIGNCEGGKKVIVYKHGTTSTSTDTK